MSRRFSFLAATVVAAVIGCGSFAQAASAVHSASCGWTTSGIQFYSPAYGEYPYYLGHVPIGGHLYREFADWNGYIFGGGVFLHYSVVYCG